MEKLQIVQPYIIRKDVPPPPDQEYNQPRSALNKFKQYTMCINCMACYAACPQYGLDPSFIGPAALAMAHRYNLDSRDQGKSERLDILGDHDGVWDCSFVGACSEVCPKGVDPAAAIQQMKVEGAKQFWLQKLPGAKK
jgi:fumarate reductase iron-sulfur subunit